MRNRLTLIFSVIIVLSFPGCDEKDNRIDDFLVEFATVIKKGNIVTFQLDDGVILTPQNTSTIKLKDGNRIILNYTTIEDDFIKVNSVRQIFMDAINEEGYPADLKTDPVKIISTWVSGNYLNISFEVSFHSKSHKTALFRDINAEVQTLYFSYSREDDPVGAPTLMYLSFNLESLQDENFSVYINTYKGERKFVFIKN